MESPLAWTSDVLHFFQKRSSIESNPSSEDGSVVQEEAPPKQIFKALMIRRMSKLRLLDAPSSTSQQPFTSTSFDTIPTVDTPIYRGTFLNHDEFQPKSCDWNPNYPWFRALTEIIDTEINFVETLETLNRVFDHVFHPNHKYIHPPLLMLRSATGTLLTLHLDVAEALHRPTDTLHLTRESLLVAKVYQKRMPYFKLYTQYCIAFKEVSALLNVRKSLMTSEVQQFVAAVRAASKLLHVDMESEMIKPVQRLCRYPLLFGELYHHARATTSLALHEPLDNLITSTKCIASCVNDRVHAEQNNARFLRLRRKLNLGFGCPEVLVPTRHYISEATVQVASLVSFLPWKLWLTKQQTLVILSDVLLVTKRVRHKRLQVSKVLPLSLLTVDDIDSNEYPNWNASKGFVLRYSKNDISTPKTYVVVCESDKKKTELLGHFRSTMSQIITIEPIAVSQPFTFRHTRLSSSVAAV